MTLENDAVAGATIELLEARLRRLSFLLTGDSHWTGEPLLPAKPDNLDDSVSRRLLRLEKDLEKISRHIPAIRDVIQLRMLVTFPPKTNAVLIQVMCLSRRPLPRPLPPDATLDYPRNAHHPKPRIDSPLIHFCIP